MTSEPPEPVTPVSRLAVPQPKRLGGASRWLFPAVAGFFTAAAIYYGHADGMPPVVIAVAAAGTITGGFSGCFPYPASFVTALLSGVLVVIEPAMHTSAGAAMLLPVAGASFAGHRRLVIFVSTWAFGIGIVEALKTLPTTSPSNVVIPLLLELSLVGLAFLGGAGLRNTTLEHEKQRRESVDNLRRSISRELHDSIAHELSVIALRADHCRTTGNATTDDLAIIARQSRQAVADLRTMIQLLRSSDDSTSTPHLAFSDAYSVIQERGRALQNHGFSFTSTCEGELSSLPRALNETLARILAEGFNNIERHAARGSVCLLTTLSSTQLELLLTNPISSPDTRPADRGLGIIGMSERAWAARGHLRVGAVGTTWVLQLTLPISHLE